MRDDLHLPITLTVADCQTPLHVIGFSGSDGLNEPFLFEIDVISADQAVDTAQLLHGDAYLAFSETRGGVHGRIAHIRRLLRGQSVDLYRITLAPALQKLARHRRRRSFNGMTAVQIILHLLQDHGLLGDAVRFQRVTGVYPVRDHCLQFDETDLHLLQRLCEEEGIHFRFEHHPRRHVLIFSDDPGDFPELSNAVRLHTPMSASGRPNAEGLEHLAECLSVATSYSTHADKGPGELAPAWMFGDNGNDEFADNQPLTHDQATGVHALTPRRRQSGVRHLERLRCERRQVVGLGNHPELNSGHVMRVIGHQASLFNDQWLLTEVQHSGKQLQGLQGLTDAASIVRALAHPRAIPFQGPAGYRNALRVIPWAMPFRAALNHPRPRIDGVQRAQLISAQADPQGRLRIRYDWQTADVEHSGKDSWARLSSSVKMAAAGSMLQVSFLDGDGDQPCITGIEANLPALAQPRVNATEGLSVRSRKALALRSAVALLEIDAGRIRVSHCGDTPASTTACPGD